MLPQNLPPSVQTSSRVIVNRYAVSKKIGSGTFGTVFLVEDNFKNKEKKVLKEICISEMNEHETQSVDREANLLSKLNHHNIVRMFESFVNEESFYIVMEFCQMGDMDKELKTWKSRSERVPQNQVLDWLVQLLMAVQYIHSQKMLHRDLKCKNVFLTQNKTVKIGDFGISRILTSTEYASTFTGTPYYMSPEVIKHDGYGSKSDIWSLGVILYEICELKRAFDGKNLMSVMMRIIQGKLPAMSSGRAQLGVIFEKMLKQDPHERPSSSQLLTEPIVAAHMATLRNRLHGKKRKREVSSASSQTSIDSSGGRKMTARERMRVEKQRRADEEAEQLRHVASENFAANRARTAERREREHNRPDIIKQASPVLGLEIKAINPSIVKYDRDFCYSPKSQSPTPRRSITAIHPEPRKRPKPKLIHDDVDRQLDAIEKSLEYAKAESLSKAIRKSQTPDRSGVEVDGALKTLNSDEVEILENSSTQSSKPSNSTIDDFVDHLEQQQLTASLQSPETTPSPDFCDARDMHLLETGASAMDTEATLSESSEESVEEAVLFETAAEECLLDISNLELTAVSQIPENEEDANTYYSLEGFEEEAHPPPREAPTSPQTLKEKAFRRSSSLNYKRDKNEGSKVLNLSLPLNSSSDPISLINLSDISDLNISNISEREDPYLNRSQDTEFGLADIQTDGDSFSISHLEVSNRSLLDVLSNRPDLNISSTSNITDYTKPSAIVLRRDRIRTLRQKCEERLGGSLFHRIYDYLEDARFGDDIVPEDVIVATLKEWVPELTSDCFIVDQLIYLEKQELLAANSLDVL